jgi:UDP-glucose 4-epimerase
MFGLSARVFRFGNVVGPRQTHGVGLDFVRRLLADPTRLAILGDGTQSKPYVHVDDVVRGVLLANQKTSGQFAAYNLATQDYVTVKEIADLAVACVAPSGGPPAYEFSGGNRGWKGDVPVVRLNTSRIRALGWANERSSHEAVRTSLESLFAEEREGRRA